MTFWLVLWSYLEKTLLKLWKSIRASLKEKMVRLKSEFRFSFSEFWLEIQNSSGFFPIILFHIKQHMNESKKYHPNCWQSNIVAHSLTHWNVAVSSDFLKFSQHTKSNHIGTIQSPGFPNAPYPPNTFIQWQLRADPGYIIKLDFDNFNLEENCRNDFVKIYDSLVALESRVLEEWVCPLPRLNTAARRWATLPLNALCVQRGFVVTPWHKCT